MSTSNNNNNPNNNDQQVSKDELIRELLQVCRTRGVDVPPGLLARIHSAEAPGQSPLLTHPQRDRRRSTHFLQQQYQKRQQQDQEQNTHDEDMEHIMRLLHSLGEGRNRFELRLHDASYVTSRKETHDLSSSARNARVADAFDIEGQNVSHATAGSSTHAPNDVRVSNILNSSPIYKLVAGITNCWKGVSQSTTINRNEILSGVNLRFTSGKSYLVLGAPSSGKSLLLKYIANLLRSDSHRKLGSKVTLNGKRPIRTDICWSSLVAYTDQIDRLHPVLTVYETLRFAFDCRAAGTHGKSYMHDNAETKALIAKMDREEFRITNILKNFGLDRVRDTYVGDDSKVRGVSGGERKRVTVCETITYAAPVMCLDEISTGLDAANTYDIVNLLTRVTRFMHIIPIVTLLQPPPEVVALFDELILLDSGRLIYSGKVEDAVGYFESLGYFLPERTDVAEWMQSLPTADGAKFLRQDPGASHRRHLSSAEFADAFQKSQLGRSIAVEIKKPLEHQVYGFIKAKEFSERYRNPWHKSIWLVFRRELLLWRRDTYNLRAKVAQDIVMGVIVGTVFWQTPASSAIFGVLFQTLLMMTLGAMLATPQQVDKRSIFYKHQDGNFFPTWTFVVGRSLAQLPQAFIDSMLYGTIVYFFVGLSYSNGATIANYFVFQLLILATTYGATLIFGVLSSALRDKAACQAGMAVLLGEISADFLQILAFVCSLHPLIHIGSYNQISSFSFLQYSASSPTYNSYHGYILWIYRPARRHS